MVNPCHRHVECPPGTGTESPGVNYSAEHIDVPEYDGNYYVPHPYNKYGACAGRCVSLISQEDADLCAARNAAICKARIDGKQTYGNTIQSCTGPNHGNLVIVPADSFFAESVAEANSQALSYANKLQQPGVLPPNTPHVTPTPTPTSGPKTSPNPIPIPLPVPKPKPPAPPTSHCKPCDDSTAVDSFALDFDVPSDLQLMVKTSPPLKCGTWQFCINTVSGGPLGYPAAVTVSAIANDPGETVQWSQTMFNIPCGPDSDCTSGATASFGYNYCCSQTCTDPAGNFLAICESGYLTKIRAYYVPEMEFTPPRHFIITGTLLAPPPP